MKQHLALTTLLVRDYDEAIAFYVDTLGFTLLQDSPLPEPEKRWVVVAPPGARESGIVLARAVGAEQEARIGDQTGGRVFMFLHTDDFWRDYQAYNAKGVAFTGGEPRDESYGIVAVFCDLYGNMWDLIEPKSDVGN